MTDRRERPAQMWITSALNAALVVIVFATAVGLLWLGSHATVWYQTLLVGILFSYVLLTNYALLHEASHNNLNSDPRLNYLLGMLAGLLFPMPLSMIQVTHQGHHLRNRTDHEMFDMYYPTDNRLLRTLQWYSILCGLFWPVIPLGCCCSHCAPRSCEPGCFATSARRAICSGIFAAPRSLGFVGKSRPLYCSSLAFWLLQLDWRSVLIMYGCFSVNWSTRQYIGHAFSKRDVIEGAWNLRHNRLMTWVLLHGEYDLNHHRRPEVPVVLLAVALHARGAAAELPLAILAAMARPSRGRGTLPERLQQLPLSVHATAGDPA